MINFSDNAVAPSNTPRRPNEGRGRTRGWMRLCSIAFWSLGAGYWTANVSWMLQHAGVSPGTPACNYTEPGMSATNIALGSARNSSAFRLTEIKEIPLAASVEKAKPQNDLMASEILSPLLNHETPRNVSPTASGNLQSQKSTKSDEFGVASSSTSTKKGASPTWYQRFVPRLETIWKSRAIDSWCQRLEPDPPTPWMLGRGELAEGLLYIKTYKASSSTCEGIALSIAHRVGQRQLEKQLAAKNSSQRKRGVPGVCKAYTRHEFANNRFHSRRHPTDSLLWTFVRSPGARDLSHVYHFEVGRNRRNMTDLEVQRHMENKLKGRQVRYLVPIKPSKAPLWPRHELRKNRTDVVRYMKKAIFDEYDFIGLTERMPESLAVMVLLWGLDPRDVVVLNSKRSGGYDDGGFENGTCTKIPKAVVTPQLQEYIDTRHAMWNADVLLYHAANASLEQTIEALGRSKVSDMADTIIGYQKLAQESCLEEANFPCNANGIFQPELAERSCYVQDAGCGHECIDRVLGL